jgi:acetolactate synthase-1/2/3 large subunit
MDSVPVVVVTGQVGTGMVGTDAFQEVDTKGITLPITKHNYLVKNPQELPRVIREAFYIARTGRPGPVVVDLPRNVAEAQIEWHGAGKVELRSYHPQYQPAPDLVDQAAEMLNKAERPVILAGGGVLSTRAPEDLVALAEKIRTPVTTTLMGIGAFPEDHELALGMLGMHGTACANYAVTAADVLLTLGARFADRVTGNVKKFAPHAKIIHVDIDPAEIGKNVRAALPVIGDVKHFLRDLLPLVQKKDRRGWLSQIAKWKVEHPLRFSEDGCLKPQYILQALGEITKGECIVATDVGQHQMWAAQFFKIRKPYTFLSSGGLGTMGYGLPAALGAQLGNPGKLVLSLTGDGSFQMNMFELGTAMQEQLPLKIFVFNNHALGMVKQLQYFYCEKRYSQVKFTFCPDFVQLARAYGAVGIRLERSEDVYAILDEVLTNGRLTIVDCIIDPEELVYPMVLAGKGIGELIELSDAR